MDSSRYRIKKCILQNNEGELVKLLKSGFNPNHEGGWPIRLAARHGLYPIVKLLMQYGANPHLISEAGASTLQLAVYSGEFWNTEKWSFLLSCCDSSQLADGAAVAMVFYNIPALKKIMETGRCNTHIPTSLTGKTVDELARGYRLQSLLYSPMIQDNINNVSPISSPRNIRQTESDYRMLSPQPPRRNLSPSVARFFNQTANQTSLTPPRNTLTPNYLPFPNF
ncbi:PREDICTED: uncharacterized protein LOC106099569 [Papilio polytes]|uniref:uncharacterized protein LOC106099569 n=1 Tax=Papilio polytes TaxID=76194 RepID=UPI0006764E2C|nr:PREDICTED: uncharacterized protein LOC106099569 [Papilio polytes]